MKILESQSAVLSNYEVYAHLTAMRATPRTAPRKPSNVDTVLKELTDYLSPPPASRSRVPRYQNPPYGAAALRALVAGLRPYDLTKSEVLMIANLRPEGLGLLDCVVEECDERFTAERQDEIVKIVGDVLGREGDGDGVDGDGVDGVDGEGGHEDGPV
ncbi:hypothetical protein HO133_011004 [Letharia lupina]|uniref:DNA-directed RNA polymerase III subunit RPC9 n=1 Tax=Letharia lupina TaxID=560253 RepID=A0A8H6CJ66_9LECA|nr:uncharacterized protein HO133_011004 [Letharia lupina]KAF6224427.1 hypothetical protein HO133_011004 [Letharia lupina]